jgi:hypothetical protein
MSKLTSKLSAAEINIATKSQLLNHTKLITGAHNKFKIHMHHNIKNIWQNNLKK